MRKNIIAGNWKMNKDYPQAITLINEIKRVNLNNNAEIILATPFPYLAKVAELVEEQLLKLRLKICITGRWCFTGRSSINI